jgi:hypothetical protein
MPNDWLIRRTKPHGTHFGRAIPAFFFHSGDYNLRTTDAYADGAVECRDFLDLPSFKSKMASGGVVTKPPKGEVVSVFNLGFATVAEQRWILEPDDIIRRVESAVRHLNPALNNLFKLPKSAWESSPHVLYVHDISAARKAGWLTAVGPSTRVIEMHDRMPCLSLDPTILGHQVPIFERQDHKLFRLKQWFVFVDGSSRIGADGRIEELEAHIESARSGLLCTQAPDGALIEVGDLGAFLASQGQWFIRIDDRIAEIRDLLGCLRGCKSAIDRYREALEADWASPSEQTRSELREAELAVPRHLKHFYHDRFSPVVWRYNQMRRLTQGDT